MAKVQRVRFLRDYHEQGLVKFRAGEHYPLTPTTLSEVLVSNHAVVESFDMDARDHERETAAAHADWNAANKHTISADRELRGQSNPAAVAADRYLDQLRACGAI